MKWSDSQIYESVKMWVEWNEWWWEKDNATMSSVDSVRVCDVDLKECDGDVRGVRQAKKAEAENLWGEVPMWVEVRAEVKWRSRRSE